MLEKIDESSSVIEKAALESVIDSVFNYSDVNVGYYAFDALREVIKRKSGVSLASLELRINEPWARNVTTGELWAELLKLYSIALASIANLERRNKGMSPLVEDFVSLNMKDGTRLTPAGHGVSFDSAVRIEKYGFDDFQFTRWVTRFEDPERSVRALYEDCMLVLQSEQEIFCQQRKLTDVSIENQSLVCTTVEGGTFVADGEDITKATLVRQEEKIGGGLSVSHLVVKGLKFTII
ncbi:hypothetical protein [Vibrio mediterranei]|uniref:hypothetical protein n=1 Tax=Vibrio mediterranei TaxID=689 RepID=UPI0040683B85